MYDTEDLRISAEHKPQNQLTEALRESQRLEQQSVTLYKADLGPLHIYYIVG